MIRRMIAQWLRRRLGVPDMGASLDRLVARGYQARRVYDIGAYRGDFTAEVLERWPRAEVQCFEPLPHMGEALRARFAQTRNVFVHDAVLGSRSGEAVSLAMAETASSVLYEYEDKPFERLERRTSSLDDLYDGGAIIGPPDLIKLDTQGYELAILQGAIEVLRGASALIIEVNLLDIHRQVPLMHEIGEWLSKQGFVAYDVAGLTRRPLDGALWQMDLVYVRVDSPLRADKRWGAG